MSNLVSEGTWNLKDLHFVVKFLVHSLFLFSAPMSVPHGSLKEESLKEEEAAEPAVTRKRKTKPDTKPRSGKPDTKPRSGKRRMVTLRKKTKHLPFDGVIQLFCTWKSLLSNMDKSTWFFQSRYSANSIINFLDKVRGMIDPHPECVWCPGKISTPLSALKGSTSCDATKSSSKSMWMGCMV